MTAMEGNAVRRAFRAPGASEWRELTIDEGAKDQQEGARKARDELKNMLLASLQLQHVVVLTGCGSSPLSTHSKNFVFPMPT